MSATIKINQKTPAGLIVPEAQIRTDLIAIAAYAKSVRPYASTQGLERVPPIAAELGLTAPLYRAPIFCRGVPSAP